MAETAFKVKLSKNKFNKSFKREDKEEEEKEEEEEEEETKLYVPVNKSIGHSSTNYSC